MRGVKIMKKIFESLLIFGLVLMLFALTGCNEDVSTKESYVGYYADIDSDGTVDGVIYVDLMNSEDASGEWRY